MNRLYRQEADGRFTDVTAESGLGDGGYGMGVAIGDIDNDGHPDVYVTNYGPDRLYRNRGDGTFEDITEAAGIHVIGWSCSAAFFDYDRDGFLDLYVTQYVDYRPKYCSSHAGRADYCGPKPFLPKHDVLLHNTGDPGGPAFTDVSESAGMASVAAAGLGVVCEDFNRDGWMDVYVANDGYANQFWINQHDGTFRESALTRRGNLDEAIATFEQAAALAPPGALLHMNWGNALKQRGNAAEAVDHYRDALALRPNYVNAHFNLALSLEHLDRVQEAIQHYRRAVAIDPNDPSSRRAAQRLAALGAAAP